MIDSDKTAFAEMFTACCFNYGRDAAKETMRLWWAVLAEYDYAAVAKAFNAHIRSSKFMPTAHELIDLIHSSHSSRRRMGPDEAWARMPRSENDSVVWTEEMAYAWGVASALVNDRQTEKPDWVAARMAFKDAYTRAVEMAKAQGLPVRWSVSRGLAKDNLEDVLTEAVRLGYLSPEQARPHWLELEYVRPMNAALLIENAAKTQAEAKEAALQAIAKLKGLFQEPKPDYDLEAVRADCEARDREIEPMGKQAAA